MYNKDTHGNTSSPVEERWAPCPFGYDGLYEVSDHGQVRSTDRTVTSRNRWGPIEKHLRGMIRAQNAGAYGYLTVNLSREGKVKIWRVHLLVAAAFLGPRPPGMDIRHGPAGRLVNAVWNLSYGSRAENEQDKIRDGTFRHGISKGEKNGNARLTGNQVIEIRRRYRAGESQSALGREFGVTYQSIRLVVYRKTWKHVPLQVRVDLHEERRAHVLLPGVLHQAVRGYLQDRCAFHGSGQRRVCLHGRVDAFRPG
jgi:hypothetical protein